MKPLTKLERASEPLGFGDALVMLVLGGGGAWLFWLAVRDLSAWLLARNLLPLALLLWAAAGGLALYLIIGWLKPEGE